MSTLIPFLAALSLPNAVPLESRVARIPDLVADLSNRSGRQLTVSRELANELVYVRAAPRSADEWMLLIADAVCGEWEKEGGSTRLIRSAALRRRLERQEIAERATLYDQSGAQFLGGPSVGGYTSANVDRLLAQSAAATAAFRNGDAKAFERVVALSADLLPTKRLGRRLLTRSLLLELATVGLGEVVTWSTRPQPGRRPLSVPADIYEQYNRERQTLVAAISARKGNRSLAAAARDYSDFLLLREEGAKPVASIVLSAERTTADMMNVIARLLDADGRKVDEFVATLYLRPSAPQWPGADGLRHETMEASSSIADIRASGQRQIVSEGFQALAADPVKHEPADLFLRPLLDFVCDRSRQQAVIGLPDASVAKIVASVRERPVLGPIVEALESQVSLRTRNGVLLGRPRYPIEATATQLDRRLLGKFIRDLEGGRSTRLDTVAAYALAQNIYAGEAQLEPLVLYAAGVSGLFNDSLGSLTLLVSGRRDALQFYGHLSPPQRQALWEGRPITLGRLPRPAREALARMIYGRNLRFMPTQPDPELEGRDGFDWLPSGLPAEMTIHPRPQRSLGVVVAEGPRRGMVLEPRNVGNVMFRQEQEGVDLERRTYPDLRKVRYWPVRRGTLELELQVGPDATTSVFFSDIEPIPGPAVQFEGLPEEIQAAVRASIETSRKNAAERRQPTPRIPPPTR